jgi:protein CpxP
MKRRVMISVVAAGLLFGSVYLAAAAGGPGFGGRGQGPGMHLERMAEVLGLSDTQKERVGAILKEEREKTEPLRQQLAENHRQLRQATLSEKFDEAAVRAIAAKQTPIRTELMVSHARAKSEIHALLTPEQRTLAEKLGPMMGPRHGHMPRFGDEE